MDNCELGVYNRVSSIGKKKAFGFQYGLGNVFVWKRKNDNTVGEVDTQHTLDYLVEKRKLFVYLGTNSDGIEFVDKDRIFSNDGKTITFILAQDLAREYKGLLSRVSSIKGNTVLVTKRVGSNDVLNFDTERTIERLISDKSLFVCDNILTPGKNSYSGQPGIRNTAAAWQNPFKTGNWVGSGKRNKSRKSKRRNSRSNRRKTLNKSKK